MTDSLQIPSRGEVIDAFRSAGGGVAAVYPIHDPRALLRAHGLLPVEVWGPPGRDTGSGDAHLQPYVCSIVRSGLSFLLDGGLKVADLLVVPHACDSLQGLASVLLDFVKPAPPVLPFYPPRGRGEAAVDFLAAELRSFAGKVGEAVGRPAADEDLHAAIDREERADACLAELLGRRLRLPMGNGSFYRLVRSREYLPAERFEHLARRALERETDAEVEGVRVILSGLVPEPMAFLDALDRAGVVVAGDDLACAGRRLYRPASDADPYRRLAASLLSAPPDSTRGSAVVERVEHLVELAAQKRSRGVLFFIVKFCEPELFYLPQLQRALEDAGLRSLKVEIDVSDALPDQVVTRLEAFGESLA